MCNSLLNGNLSKPDKTPQQYVSGYSSFQCSTLKTNPKFLFKSAFICGHFWIYYDKAKILYM